MQRHNLSLLKRRPEEKKEATNEGIKSTISFPLASNVRNNLVMYLYRINARSMFGKHTRPQHIDERS